MGKLAAMGVKEVQLHEPALVMWDSSTALAAMFKKAYFAVRNSHINRLFFLEHLESGQPKGR